MSRLTGQAYQYLQRSKLPTDKFQRSLPRLKIPKLEKTCQRYLNALEPIFVKDARYGSSVSIMNEFQAQGQAIELHSALLAYDKTVKHTSYINEFWFDMYLASRSPLPLNFNPFMVWKDANTQELNDQIVRSTNLLISAMRFKRSLEENVLEPEVFHLNPKKVPESYTKVLSLTPDTIATYMSFLFKAFPLDMSQYKNLFNSTRIPKLSKDVISKSDPKKNHHVVVLRNGHFYSFDILEDDGSLKSPESIYSNLRHIVEKSQPVDGKFLSIAEYTSANRDVWAKEREHLVNLSEKNDRNLNIIDGAILTICLDDITYQDESQKLDAAHNFLHGSNTKGPLNRWFDKSLSIMVTDDGHAAINFEHSWGDGVAVLRFFNETFNDSMKNPQLTKRLEGLDKAAICVQRLDFDLDARLKETIAECRKEHAKVTGNLELGVIDYGDFNRDYFKRNKLSSDAMSQLSFQLAFKKLYNKTPVTYESCSTAAFKGGRTETVRPCTNETNAACKAILENRTSSKMSNGELKGLLKKASEKHYQLCKEASMGDGFDRHLFAMKELALRTNQKLPDLYSDPIYQESQHYTLSTSTLPSEAFSGAGFAPVVPDGFGLGYGHIDSKFGVLVASYKSHRNNGQFVQALNESLDDIRKIVEK